MDRFREALFCLARYLVEPSKRWRDTLSCFSEEQHGLEREAYKTSACGWYIAM
jgi:hypothetical protein